MQSSRTNLPILTSYAITASLFALSLAIHDALTFHPGGEFGSPTATFVFILGLWGVVAFAFGVLPLVFIFAALTGLHRVARLPWLVGGLYGLLYLGGTGIGGAPLPTSLTAAALVSPLAFVLAYRSRPEATPGA